MTCQVRVVQVFDPKKGGNVLRSVGPFENDARLIICRLDTSDGEVLVEEVVIDRCDQLFRLTGEKPYPCTNCNHAPCLSRLSAIPKRPHREGGVNLAPNIEGDGA